MIKNILIGQKFNRLTAVRFSHKRGSQRYWLFKCDCGKEKLICKYRVMSGKTKSCGCYSREVARRTQAINFKKHGLTGTRIFEIYRHMVKRCYNNKNKDFHSYGARGVSIFKEWLENPKSFYDWSVENGYKDELTIDRIDVNGNYEPRNCRWVDMKTQQRNKRNTISVVYKGVEKPLIEWCEILGLKYGTVKTGVRVYGRKIEDYVCQNI